MLKKRNKVQNWKALMIKNSEKVFPNRAKVILMLRISKIWSFVLTYNLYFLQIIIHCNSLVGFQAVLHGWNDIMPV